MCQWLGSHNPNPSNANWNSFMSMLSATIYAKKLWVSHHSMISFHLQTRTMDTSQYWPFAWEYSIWNATVSVLQLWTADLYPHVLSNAIDQVYVALFYSGHTEQIQNLPEEILFSNFMTTLNDTFELSLHRRMKVIGVAVKTSTSPPHSAEPWESTMDDVSFNPANFGWPPMTP